MKVIHHGRGEFYVESHGNTYLVDTLAFKGNGFCGCWSFARLRKDLEEAVKKRGFDPSLSVYKCPHIQRADAHLLQMFKRDLMKKFPDDQSNQP